MRKKIKHFITAVTLATVTVLLALFIIKPVARAADQCVAPGGAGGCFSTVQAAVNAVGNGETVRVVAGTYNENVVINKSLTLLGGFTDTSLTSRTPRTSIIDGGGVGPVIRITNGAIVIIDGFTIRNGNATTNSGQGGGLNVLASTATIRDNLIENNVASTNAGTAGRGGGIDGFNSTLRIENNTIQANVAYSVTSGATFGGGGGIALFGSGTAVISGNQILSNTGAINKSPQSGSQGFGGGIKTEIDAVTVNNNTIQDNLGATGAELAAGGGLDLFGTSNVTITDNIITKNTASISSTRFVGGGGILLGNNSGSGHLYKITDNQIIANTAAMNLSGPNIDGGGGGVYITGGGAGNDTLTMQNNMLVSNTAVYTMISPNGATFLTANGGGLSIALVRQSSLISNEVRANVTVKRLTMTGSGGFVGRPAGGGIAIFRSELVTATNNLIKDNVTTEQQTLNGVSSGSEGGGLHLNSATNATVQNNTIINNIAVISGSLTSNTGESYFPNGGGFFAGCFEIPTCAISVLNNKISDNIAGLTVTLAGSNVNGGAGGGGVSLIKMSPALVQSNIISGNEAHRASDGGSSFGGSFGAGMNVQESVATLERNQILGNRRNGVWAWQSTVTSTNNIFARNFDGLGAGNNSIVRVINDTYYDNGNEGVSASSDSTMMVTNSIIVNHKNGLSGNIGNLSGNYNLLKNDDNYAGSVPGGPNDITGQDPLFQDAANDNFHLTSNSPAIDKGTATSAPSVDFEGDSRPQQLGIDIGADEFALQGVFLPLVLK